MAKKSKKRLNNIVENNGEQQSEFSDAVEDKFKLMLRIMSWVVGICFVLIIILPNFEFILVDVLVKFVFFLGVFIVLVFVLLEMFGPGVKKIMAKYLD